MKYTITVTATTSTGREVFSFSLPEIECSESNVKGIPQIMETLQNRIEQLPAFQPAA